MCEHILIYVNIYEVSNTKTSENNIYMCVDIHIK